MEYAVACLVVAVYFVIGLLAIAAIPPMRRAFLCASDQEAEGIVILLWPFILIGVTGFEVYYWLNPPRDPDEVNTAEKPDEPHHWGSE